MKSWTPVLTDSPQQPLSCSLNFCSHFTLNWATSKSVYLWVCVTVVLKKDLCLFAWKPLCMYVCMCACVFVRARGWTCVRVRTREWVSQCSKQSEAHGKASVLDESPEQATRRLCCDVRKATDRSAAKPEAPQADGWGVLMEPRLACVSAGVCGRAALRGLIMQVSWWSPWNRASQHFPTNCRCIGGSGKQRVFERGRHTCTGLCSYED